MSMRCLPKLTKIEIKEAATLDNEKFLSHYGVPGMRWGHRRAAQVVGKAAITARKKIIGAGKAIGERAKLAGEFQKNSFLHPIASNKAVRDASVNDSIGKQIRRSYVQTNKELRDINARVNKILEPQRLAKQKMKDVKAKYSEEYMSQMKTKTQKLISKIGGSDKIYADLMYNLNNKGD